MSTAGTITLSDLEQVRPAQVKFVGKRTFDAVRQRFRRHSTFLNEVRRVCGKHPDDCSRIAMTLGGEKCKLQLSLKTKGDDAKLLVFLSGQGCYTLGEQLADEKKTQHTAG